MASDPELRKEILTRLIDLRVDFGRCAVNGRTLGEVKLKLGLPHVSNTQFSRAVRSLHYNPDYKAVEITRYPMGYDEVYDMGHRGYIVTAM